MSAASTPDITERLAAVLSPAVEGFGLDLEAVELTKAGKHSVLRVAVDKDGGVDMDDIADATRAVSTILDEVDLLGKAPYTLEVSSPGIDRIRAADETGAALLVDGEEVRIVFDEVRRATVQVEFKPAGRNAVSDDEDGED